MIDNSYNIKPLNSWKDQHLGNFSIHPQHWTKHFGYKNTVYDQPLKKHLIVKQFLLVNTIGNVQIILLINFLYIIKNNQIYTIQNS